MKKLLCLALAALLLLPVMAIAETDLTSMSFEELVALQKSVVKEIMSRPEWKEVEVPNGNWKVGEDIPEGRYSVSCSGFVGFQVWGDKADDYATNGGLIKNELLQAGSSIGSLKLEDGYEVVVSGGTVTFAPAIGLGF